MRRGPTRTGSAAAHSHASRERHRRTSARRSSSRSAPRGAAAVDLPAQPEVLHSPDGRTPEELHEALKAHRNLLYVDVWEAFCRGDGLPSGGYRRGARRGVRQLPRPRHADTGHAADQPAYAPEAARPPPSAPRRLPTSARTRASSSTAPSPTPSSRPSGRSSAASPPGPTSAISSPAGVFDWRAIYITALGSSSQYGAPGARAHRAPKWRGEAAIRVPEALLEADEKPFALAGEPRRQPGTRACRRPRRQQPSRPLPAAHQARSHPRQIGRIAERINTMGTHAPLCAQGLGGDAQRGCLHPHSRARSSTRSPRAGAGIGG